MRKFTGSFDDYTVDGDPLMSVELHGQGQVRYLHHLDNPIYYCHAFQYTHGSLFRAIYGYETFWDKELESEMIHHIDEHLRKLEKRRLYYLEEIVFDYGVELWGVAWPRQLPRLPEHHKQFPLLVKQGAKALARVNLIDRPNHVDIEFHDGSVFSINYMRYLQLKRKHIRSLDHADPKQGGTSTENGKQPKSEEAPESSRHFAFRALAPEMYRVRKRFRGLL